MKNNKINNELKQSLNEIAYSILIQTAKQVETNIVNRNNFLLNQTLSDFYQTKITFLYELNEKYKLLNIDLKNNKISNLVNENDYIFNEYIIKNINIEESIVNINNNLDFINNEIKLIKGDNNDES